MSVIQETAVEAVQKYYNEEQLANLDNLNDGRPLEKTQIYVVWWVKVLKNWKGLLGTTLEDGLYFEVTYNGEENDMYMDAYTKTGQVVTHEVY